MTVHESHLKPYEAAEKIREVLDLAGVNVVMEEVGVRGDLRVTLSVVVPVEAAEEIFDLVKRSVVRRS
jgi:hypothetical protein